MCAQFSWHSVVQPARHASLPGPQWVLACSAPLLMISSVNLTSAKGHTYTSADLTKSGKENKGPADRRRAADVAAAELSGRLVCLQQRAQLMQANCHITNDHNSSDHLRCAQQAGWQVTATLQI